MIILEKSDLPKDNREWMNRRLLTVIKFIDNAIPYNRTFQWSRCNTSLLSLKENSINFPGIQWLEYVCNMGSIYAVHVAWWRVGQLISSSGVLYSRVLLLLLAVRHSTNYWQPLYAHTLVDSDSVIPSKSEKDEGWRSISPQDTISSLFAWIKSMLWLLSYLYK